MKTLTTTEALQYIQSKTGKTGKPYHKQQLNRWQRYGWIKRHTVGVDGGQNTYTIDALDGLVKKINGNYRRGRKP